MHVSPSFKKPWRTWRLGELRIVMVGTISRRVHCSGRSLFKHALAHLFLSNMESIVPFVLRENIRLWEGRWRDIDNKGKGTDDKIEWQQKIFEFDTALALLKCRGWCDHNPEVKILEHTVQQAANISAAGPLWIAGSCKQKPDCLVDKELIWVFTA